MKDEKFPFPRTDYRDTTPLDYMGVIKLTGELAAHYQEKDEKGRLGKWDSMVWSLITSAEFYVFAKQVIEEYGLEVSRARWCSFITKVWVFPEEVRGEGRLRPVYCWTPAGASELVGYAVSQIQKECRDGVINYYRFIDAYQLDMEALLPLAKRRAEYERKRGRRA